MGEQFWREFLSGLWLNQNSLKASTTTIFQRGYAISVGADKNNSVNGMIVSVGRNIKPNTHIDTFLLKIRDKVIVSKIGLWFYGCSFGLVAAKFQDATTYRK